MLEKIYKNDFKIIGNEGENEASQFLEKKGYEIIKRNFSCRQGEIDIIAKDGKEYVFCEVKTRRNKNYGEPIDAITISKKKHIIEATKFFIYKYKLVNPFVRFDVIEIYISQGIYKIHHVKNVDLA